MIEVLEDRPDDPVVQELVSFIEAMSEDEQVDLATLVWLGRGDGAVDEWGELRAEAGRAYNRRTPSYLLGMRLSRSSAFRAKSLKRTTCANRPGTNPLVRHERPSWPATAVSSRPGRLHRAPRFCSAASCCKTNIANPTRTGKFAFFMPLV
jgi:hypothetical protein